MKARDLMTPDVATCRPDEPMAEAARIMWERDCGIVPVVDAEGRPVGVVTDRDLCMASFTRNEPLSRMPVRDAMAKEVFSCREDDDESATAAAGPAAAAPGANCPACAGSAPRARWCGCAAGWPMSRPPASFTAP